MEEMISIKEASNLTGKSEGTIRTWVNNGYVPVSYTHLDVYKRQG